MKGLKKNYIPKETKSKHTVGDIFLTLKNVMTFNPKIYISSYYCPCISCMNKLARFISSFKKRYLLYTVMIFIFF